MSKIRFVAPPGEPVMVMTRAFRAPPALIWRAISQPEHAIRWWGPHAHKNRVIEMDFRVGGKWKFETTTEDGQVINFHGEYRDIQGPQTVTQTFGVEGMFDGAFSVDTVMLEEIGDQTLYIGVSRLPDVAARDGMLASGWEYGAGEGFERLDQILKELKAATV